jgi:hypothetical protein
MLAASAARKGLLGIRLIFAFPYSRALASNEKEISHGRVPWQAH